MTQAVESPQAAEPVLSGIRVLDLSGYVAGPYCCALLADLGADVIKVEPPDGDYIRNYPPTLQSVCRLFVGVNRGKRGIVLDLKTAEGVTLLKELASRADVLVHNFRHGVAQRLGIGEDVICALNPRLVYAHLSAYGEVGPMRDLPGFDQVLQSMTGISVGQAEKGEVPQIVWGSVVDYFAAFQLALGIIAALYQRRGTGHGQFVGASLLSAALSFQSGRFVHGVNEGPEAQHYLRSSGVSGIFPTREGYIYISSTTPHFWRALCRIVGCEDMAEDPRFDDVRKRAVAEALIRPRLVTALAHRTAEEWERLLSQEVPCAVSRDIADIFDHPQVVAAGHVGKYDSPSLGRYLGFRAPIHFSAGAPVPLKPAPGLGEHTREILQEAGLSNARIESLIEQGGIQEEARRDSGAAASPTEP